MVPGEHKMTKLYTKEEKVHNEAADVAYRKQMTFATQRPKYTFWTSLCASFITLRRGWKIFRGYNVAFAGLSLASLYLTVLSFHHITVGMYKVLILVKILLLPFQRLCSVLYQDLEQIAVNVSSLCFQGEKSEYIQIKYV